MDSYQNLSRFPHMLVAGSVNSRFRIDRVLVRKSMRYNKNSSVLNKSCVSQNQIS
jgi:hypothetical protein